MLLKVVPFQFISIADINIICPLVVIPYSFGSYFDDGWFTKSYVNIKPISVIPFPQSTK